MDEPAERSETAAPRPRPSRLEAGEYVVLEPAGEGVFYIIEEGEVELLRRVGQGNERFELLGRGDIFGGMASSDESTPPTKARARTPCALLPIDSATFERLVLYDPRVALLVIRRLTARLDRLATELPAIAAAGGEARLPSAAEGAKPRLVHAASAIEFPLSSKGTTSIGRHDSATGFSPDIDLSRLDEGKTTSRHHARITEKDGHFYLVEEPGVANGTYVNGARLEAGSPRQLNAGDRLGFGEVETEFALD